MANTHIRFKEDEDDDYSVSDSDDDYTEQEKNLLQKVRNRKRDDSESDDEVYALGGDDDEDSGSSKLALSDIEGQEDDDDLPNIRAWGKDKRKFYSTDFVDPDYGGFQGKTATLAELEEEEAKNLQKQLIQELDEGDFSLEMFVKKKEPEDKEQLEEVVKTDVSKLSKRQKLQLLKQESPEFFELINDFNVKITLAKDTLKPIIDFAKNDKIQVCDALDFVKFYYRLILNYTTNISMYLLLKASKINLKNHPIIKRLFQYRQHLSQMDGVYEEVIKPQIELLINIQENGEKDVIKKKTLKLITNLKHIKEKTSNNIEDEEDLKENNGKEVKLNKKDTDVNNSKRVKFAEPEGAVSDSSDSDDSKDNEKEEKMEDDFESDKTATEKRAITYQIAKNKGLTPHRKKEQRNPRVKHRNKFRKAKIRRKGAVREVRKEMSRYGGEISGIKASVTKSIKIKS